MKKILSPRWCKRVITWRLAGNSPTEFRLAFAIDEVALKALEDELFAKRISYSLIATTGQLPEL